MGYGILHSLLINVRFNSRPGMFHIKTIRFFLALILLVSQSAIAVVVDDLYVVELAVPDQTTTVRLDTFKQGFQQVIVKVSGSDAALKSRAFISAQSRSDRYIKQFSYVQASSGSQEASEDEAVDVLNLRMSFNQRLIESLLRENGFPVWGRERPSSLVVISYDVNENIKLVSDGNTPELIGMLDERSRAYGVPLLFPLLDLEDIALVDVGVVASREYSSIEAMAARYSPDALIVGQLIGRSGGGWQGDWEVRSSGQLFRWKFQAASKEEVIDQVIRNLAKVLANEFALEVNTEGNQQLLVRVDSVADLQDVIALQQYFSRLSVIESVRVALISANTVSFELVLRNQIEDLQKLLEIGSVLDVSDFPEVNPDGENQVILNYVYSGQGVNN